MELTGLHCSYERGCCGVCALRGSSPTLMSISCTCSFCHLRHTIICISTHTFIHTSIFPSTRTHSYAHGHTYAHRSSSSPVSVSLIHRSARKQQKADERQLSIRYSQASFRTRSRAITPSTPDAKEDDNTPCDDLCAQILTEMQVKKRVICAYTIAIPKMGCKQLQYNQS